MTIKKAKLKFKSTPIPRTKTNYFIVHHTGEPILQTVEQIHNFYLTRDNGTYIGIGYNYYVRKDGSIWQGRPENAVGGHCLNYNHDSIGICFEGNYEVEAVMPTAQYKSGVELLKYLMPKYKEAVTKKHKELYPTACCGKNFPYDKMVKEAKETPKPVVTPTLKVGSKVNIISNKLYSKSTSIFSVKPYYKTGLVIEQIFTGTRNPYMVTYKTGIVGFCRASDLKIIG